MNIKNNKKISNNKVLKAGVLYTISNFIVKGIPFILTPIFTRIMTEVEIGAYSNIISWFSLLAIVVTFNFFSSVSIARFDYKENLDEYISSSLFLGSIITFGFYSVVLIFHEFFENLFMIDFKTLNIIFIYLLVYPAIQMFQIKNQITYNYIPTVLVTLLNCIITSIISVLLTLILPNRLEGRVLGYFIPSIIFSLIIYLYLMLKGRDISSRYWKYAITISFPLIWHILAGNLLASSDKIMISKILGTEYNALYSVAYTLSMIVSILWSSMNNAWSPWAYEIMDKKDYSQLKNKSKPYFIFFLVVVFIIMLVAPEALFLLGGKEYMEAKYVIPPVMTGCIFQFVYSLYVNIEFYHKRQKNIAIGTIITAITNIILNYIFVPRFGYIAAAYTTLIGYILLYLIHFCFVKKLGCTWWYDTIFFVKSLLISLFVMFISNVLYKVNIVRYVVILSILFYLMILIIKNIKILKLTIKQKSFSALKEFKF